MRVQSELLTLLATLACLIGAGGCASQSEYHAPGVRPSSLHNVAVIPFDNLSGHPNAGLILSELFQAELYSTGRVDLVPARRVTAKLAAHEGEAMPPKKIGELLEADLLVVGKVTEYTYKTGLGEDPAIGLSVRLVDPETGAVLWSGARSETGRYSWVKEDSLSRLGQAICRRLAAGLLGETGKKH